MKTKTCKQCNETKPREQFYKLTGSQYKPEWDCRDSYCIPCRISYQDIRRKNIKKQAVEYMGGKCLDCGIKSEYYAIYDFHHLDPTEKDFSIAQKSNKPFNLIKSELDKCIMLCSNCHRIRHVIEDSNNSLSH